MSTMTPAELLNAAHQAQQVGGSAEAVDHLERLLAIEPTNPMALNMLGMLMLAPAPARAADLFSRAAAGDPGAGPLWMNLATARRRLADTPGEREALTRALELDQLNFMALVRMAELHERSNERSLALQRWAGVLALATRIDPRPPEVEQIRAHAAAFIADSNRSFGESLERSLGASFAAMPHHARRRFEACVDHVLGRRAIYNNQCDGLHYPFLPADEFFDREHFPWFPQIEAQTGAIRTELEAEIARGSDAFTPYVAMESGLPDTIWSALDHSLDWSALHLWRHGERDEAVCARFPATAAALEALPLARMPRRTPTAFFSIVKPHTRLPPHTGVSNTRAIIHLPLIVPEGCGFRVGGETRQWKVGEAFAFDDTIQHEAWNDSDEPRAILIFDTWNPHLTEAERGLLQAYFATADESGSSAKVAD